MPFSVSKLTECLAGELTRSPAALGDITEMMPDIHRNLADQFLGKNPDTLIFSREGDGLPEAETFPAFRVLADPPVSLPGPQLLQFRGAQLIAMLSEQVVKALIHSVPSADVNDYGVQCAAYEVVGHIGLTEFRELSADVVQKAGIVVQGEPSHELEVLSSKGGAVCLRRDTLWQNAQVDGEELGQLKASWEMTFSLVKSRSTGFLFSASLSSLSLAVRDKQANQDASTTTNPDLPPSVFAQALQTTIDSMEGARQTLGLSNIDIQLDVVSESDDTLSQMPGDNAPVWRGWRAKKEAIEPQFIVRSLRREPLTAEQRTAFSTSSDAFIRWFSETEDARLHAHQKNKFRFEYSANDLNIKQKLIEEDQFALSVLQSKDTEAVVKSVSKKLADYLEKVITVSAQGVYIESVKQMQKKMIGEWPVATQLAINDFNSLLDTLRGQPDPVVLLSLIWPMFLGQTTSEAEGDLVDRIYKLQIEGTKDYLQDNGKRVAPESTRFGNSLQVDSDLFSSERFFPFARDIDYRSMNAASENRIVARMSRKDLPYISGLSGMASLTCKLLSNLYIHPHSDTGKKFCEAMSAFIVGSGMHSYYEVYKAFNLYAREIGPPLDVDPSQRV